MKRMTKLTLLMLIAFQSCLQVVETGTKAVVP